MDRDHLVSNTYVEIVKKRFFQNNIVSFINTQNAQ